MIWLIGNKGMLGLELGRRLTDAGLSWIGTDREVDITDFDAIESYIQKYETDSYLKSHSTGQEALPLAFRF